MKTVRQWRASGAPVWDYPETASRSTMVRPTARRVTGATPEDAIEEATQPAAAQSGAAHMADSPIDFQPELTTCESYRRSRQMLRHPRRRPPLRRLRQHQRRALMPAVSDSGGVERGTRRAVGAVGCRRSAITGQRTPGAAKRAATGTGGQGHLTSANTGRCRRPGSLPDDTCLCRRRKRSSHPGSDAAGRSCCCANGCECFSRAGTPASSKKEWMMPPFTRPSGGASRWRTFAGSWTHHSPMRSCRQWRMWCSCPNAG